MNNKINCLGKNSPYPLGDAQKPNQTQPIPQKTITLEQRTITNTPTNPHNNTTPNPQTIANSSFSTSKLGDTSLTCDKTQQKTHYPPSVQFLPNEIIFTMIPLNRIPQIIDKNNLNNTLLLLSTILSLKTTNSYFNQTISTILSNTIKVIQFNLEISKDNIEQVQKTINYLSSFISIILYHELNDVTLNLSKKFPKLTTIKNKNIDFEIDSQNYQMPSTITNSILNLNGNFPELSELHLPGDFQGTLTINNCPKLTLFHLPSFRKDASFSFLENFPKSIHYKCRNIGDAHKNPPLSLEPSITSITAQNLSDIKEFQEKAMCQKLTSFNIDGTGGYTQRVFLGKNFPNLESLCCSIGKKAQLELQDNFPKLKTITINASDRSKFSINGNCSQLTSLKFKSYSKNKYNNYDISINSPLPNLQELIIEVLPWFNKNPVTLSLSSSQLPETAQLIHKKFISNDEYINNSTYKIQVKINNHDPIELAFDQSILLSQYSSKN